MILLITLLSVGLGSCSLPPWAARNMGSYLEQGNLCFTMELGCRGMREAWGGQARTCLLFSIPRT